MITPAEKMLSLGIVASLFAFGCLTADDYRPRAAAPEQPAADAGNGGHDVPPAAAVDSRPVVEVDSRDNCVPCAAFERWHAEHGDGFPIRFDVKHHKRTLPNRVYRFDTGTPAFWWDDDNGKPVYVSGWSGPETFLASWKQSNPQGWAKLQAGPVAASAPAAGESISQLFGKFAGPGRFSYRPDKPVKAAIDADTVVEYSQISGTSKIMDGKVTIVLDQPLPIVHKRVGKGLFKWWIAVNPYQAREDLDAKPKAIAIDHNYGTYRLEIKEQPNGR